MTPTNDLHRILAATRTLNPTRLATKLDEYTRGGTVSGGDGRRSANTPDIHLDALDRQALQDHTHYTAAIHRAANALDAACRIQMSWLTPVGPLEPEPDWCANPLCHHGPDGQAKQTGLDPSNPNDRLITGPHSKLKICQACYMHEYRTGQRCDRPREGAAP